MSKLIQLKDKNGNNMDSINHNYESRISNLEGTTLFQGSSTGNITLNDSASNYRSIEILYKSQNNVYNSVKVDNPNGKRIMLIVDGENLSEYFIPTIVYIDINANTITRGKNITVQLQNNTLPSIDSNNSYYTLSITKVIGYK